MFNKFCYLLLFFFVYSFLGWVAEVVTEFYHHKRFVNRGFLIGPWCPIYGVAAVIITKVLSKYLHSLTLLFIMSMLVCGLLEYFTSYIMEKLFKARWWDYSEKKYNINGRVSLDALLLFAFGSMIIIYFVNPLVYKLFLVLQANFVKLISLVLLVIFIIDVVISFKTIYEVRNTIKNEEKDNTYEITKKVKERLKNKSYFIRRLINAFPKIKTNKKI